jgi:cytochrome P450 family 9
MSDTDILAQAFTFFLAGFETVSALSTMTCLVLGGLPEVQEKLRNEVDAAFEQAEDRKLTYETIQRMKYLDNVLSGIINCNASTYIQTQAFSFAEVLRLVSITAAGDRVCTKDLELPEYNLKIKKGDIMLIPFYAFQMDSQYFSDPEEFIPERFNDENKHKIAPFTYMPFGSGPRNCIGK